MLEGGFGCFFPPARTHEKLKIRSVYGTSHTAVQMVHSDTTPIAYLGIFDLLFRIRHFVRHPPTGLRSEGKEDSDRRKPLTRKMLLLARTLASN